MFSRALSAQTGTLSPVRSVTEAGSARGLHRSGRGQSDLQPRSKADEYTQTTVLLLSPSLPFCTVVACPHELFH